MYAIMLLRSLQHTSLVISHLHTFEFCRISSIDKVQMPNPLISSKHFLILVLLMRCIYSSF